MWKKILYPVKPTGLLSTWLTFDIFRLWNSSTGTKVLLVGLSSLRLMSCLGNAKSTRNHCRQNHHSLCWIPSDKELKYVPYTLNVKDAAIEILVRFEYICVDYYMYDFYAVISASAFKGFPHSPVSAVCCLCLRPLFKRNICLLMTQVKLRRGETKEVEKWL